MTPTRAEYQERQDQVLGIVVNEYIRTVSPISSGHIVQGYSIDLSPATVRNILAELEEQGYLTHPHKSAGRIPNKLGYRYYVDHLMDEIKLLEEEKLRIKQAYDRDVKDLEILLDKTSRVISDVTQYTSIISVDGWNDRIFLSGTSNVAEYIEEVSKIRDTLKALERKQQLLKIINQDLKDRIQIYIGHEMALSEIDGCSLAVSRYETGNGPSGRIAILGPTCMDYRRVVSALGYIREIMRNII